MSLFTPRAFAGSAEDAQAIMAAHPFATLITVPAGGGEPHITHVPLQRIEDALWGHMARANPHWRAFAEGTTVAIFHGPHAYVSPRGYVEPEANVPTWNYATVHVHGRPAVIEAPSELRRIVTGLTSQFEPDGFAPAQARVDALLGGIVGFRMPIARLDAKFKMSQNKSAADREGVVTALSSSGRADDAAVAAWMRAVSR